MNKTISKTGNKAVHGTANKSKSKQVGADNICPYAKKCGGCDYQGTEYEKQLQKKSEQVQKLLKPFSKVEPIVGMENPYHYRHKVHAVFDCVAKPRTMPIVAKYGCVS